MDLGLADAAVVVAGGTSGMGRAAADCFAADGARVAVLARTPTGVGGDHGGTAPPWGPRTP